MKNKIKFLIASVSIAMLFFSSCEKEMYDDAIYQSQQPQNLSISKISFKELKSNKKAVQKIKNVMTKKLPSSLSQRAVYNEDFGVLIDTTNIVQMVSETEQSLTFNIVDYTDSTKKENLILVSKDDGSFEAYIAEYNLTQQDLDILASGGTLENLQPTNISEIENASKIAVSGSCVMTSTYTVGMCENANGDIIENNGNLGNDCVGNWFDVEYQVISIDYSCISQGGGSLYTGSGISSESSGSGSNSSSGSGYSGGSGYNGSFSGNYINTTFVSCSTCPEFSLEFEDFFSNLTNNQIEWWNNQINLNSVNEIINYLNVNNYSIPSKDFIYQLINEIILNSTNPLALNQNLILEINNPVNRITDINEYLKCFNLTQPATFTIYVDQPIPNENDTWAGNPMDPDVGHTFIAIKQGGIRRIIGFYPSLPVDLNAPSSPGSFENDSAHVYDVAMSININTAQLVKLIAYIKLKASSTYNLNSFNCTDFGMNASTIVGMPLGSAYGSWGVGSGDNPGQLGQNIRNMPTPDGGIKTTTSGNAASNIGTCN